MQDFFEALVGPAWSEEGWRFHEHQGRAPRAPLRAQLFEADRARKGPGIQDVLGKFRGARVPLARCQ